MNIERKILVGYMLGFIDASKPGMIRTDRLILLDQRLIDFNMPPLTQEERLEFLEELSLEMDGALMLGKINRDTQRDLVQKSNRKILK